jgi:Cu/Ag efflux protein CusF
MSEPGATALDKRPNFPNALSSSIKGHPMKTTQLLAALALTITTAAMATLPQTDGEVRKIDLGAKKITLRHGEIRNLDMPPMTMVFQVKDPAMLHAVKVGDKVRFTVESANGAMTILSLEPARQ